MEKWVLEPPALILKTEIYFGLDCLREVCGERGIVLADRGIAEGHGAALAELLGFELIAVSGKTREEKERVEDELFQRRVGRDWVIVAVGGGTTTDLAGFVASTYMRGVGLVLVPTTLMAMVDAAIGGKTGIDTRFGKNLVGSFYLPKAVFIDVGWLKTLPEREMKNGWAEVLKYGLIADEGLWMEEDVEEVVRGSILCKKKIVEADFEEKTGLRRILNFGHTVGHALEWVFDYKIAHGEAVAIGCMAESYLSYLLGYLAKDALEEILKRYQTLGYRFRRFEAKAVMDAMAMDKKGKGGEPRFVLIDRIGRSVSFDGEYCRTVGRMELEKMIAWINHD